LRGTWIAGLTREPSIAEFFGFGAPMMNGTFFAFSPLPIVTIPDTGVGGRPPPVSVDPVGVTQKSGIAYDLAMPRFAEQLALSGVDTADDGRLVPKYD
jgi:hypothetical protein